MSNWTSSFATSTSTWPPFSRSEEHTSELQSQSKLVCRHLLEKNKQRRPVICEFNEVAFVQVVIDTLRVRRVTTGIKLPHAPVVLITRVENIIAVLLPTM